MVVPCRCLNPAFDPGSCLPQEQENLMDAEERLTQMMRPRWSWRARSPTRGSGWRRRRARWPRKLEGELSDLKWDLEGLETTLAKTEKEKQVGRPWGPSPVPSQDRGTTGLALQGHSRSPHSGAALDPSHPATRSYFNFIQCCFKRGSCVDLATFPGLSSLVWGALLCRRQHTDHAPLVAKSPAGQSS